MIVPIPLSMENIGNGVPMANQDSVVDCPTVMVGVDAVNVDIVGAKLAACVVALADVDWAELLLAAS